MRFRGFLDGKLNSMVRERRPVWSDRTGQNEAGDTLDLWKPVREARQRGEPETKGSRFLAVPFRALFKR